MKATLAALVLFAFLICNSHAETFSSSTNFIQTITIGTNEAIFITTLKQSGNINQPLLASVSRSNNTMVLPIWCPGSSVFGSMQVQNGNVQALAGPMDIQFQQANVLMEFQRIQTTNVFTTVFDATNGVSISVPAGKTINFLPPASWYFADFSSTATALITLSNSVTMLNDSLYGGENFSGPLTIRLVAGSQQVGNEFIGGWVTYYFTEEFASLPNIGATVVPAGNSVIAIEKSLDLQHWGTVYFKLVGNDQLGFYRFKISN